MNKITDDVIDKLATYNGDTVLSIYIPTHSTPTPPNVTENQIRFKNLVHKGLEQWSHDERHGKTNEIKDQLLSYIDDTDFWHHVSKGMAIFISSEGSEIYHLPIEITEQVYVGESFDILPLLHLKSINEPYYLFALAMHEPKLFKGDIYGLQPVSINFPKSPEDALNIDEMFISSNTVRAGSGSMQGSPHGQGDSQKAGQEERLMYFRILDNMIMKSKKIDTSHPILIAATDSEAADYRNLSKLPNILEKHLAGNRTKDEGGVLHELSYELVSEELLSKHMEALAERYETAVGAAKTSETLGDIERAAQEGRVDTLLLSPYEESNDSISDVTNSAILRMFADIKEKSRLLPLVTQVIKKGGHIDMFNRRLMPARVTVAALYRY